MEDQILEKYNKYRKVSQADAAILMEMQGRGQAVLHVRS